MACDLIFSQSYRMKRNSDWASLVKKTGLPFTTLRTNTTVAGWALFLTGIPEEFIKHLAKTVGFSSDHEFIAAGNVFLPNEEAEREKCKNLFAQNINRFGQKLLTWREVPIDPDRAGIGKTARRGMPVIAQVFIGSEKGLTQAEFERRLFMIRWAGHVWLVLRLFAVVSGFDLQRNAFDRATAWVLRRFAESVVLKSFGDGSLTVFNQHATELVACSAVALVCSQRRD